MSAAGVMVAVKSLFGFCHDVEHVGVHADAW